MDCFHIFHFQLEKIHILERKKERRMNMVMYQQKDDRFYQDVIEKVSIWIDVIYKNLDLYLLRTDILLLIKEE